MADKDITEKNLEAYNDVLKSEGGKPKTMCEVLDRMFKKKDAEIAELKQEKAAADKENAELKQEIVKLKAALAAKD